MPNSQRDGLQISIVAVHIERVCDVMRLPILQELRLCCSIIAQGRVEPGVLFIENGNGSLFMEKPRGVEGS